MMGKSGSGQAAWRERRRRSLGVVSFGVRSAFGFACAFGVSGGSSTGWGTVGAALGGPVVVSVSSEAYTMLLTSRMPKGALRLETGEVGGGEGSGTVAERGGGGGGGDGGGGHAGLDVENGGVELLRQGRVTPPRPRQLLLDHGPDAAPVLASLHDHQAWTSE